jgi:hypothetical protein
VGCWFSPRTSALGKPEKERKQPVVHNPTLKPQGPRSQGPRPYSADQGKRAPRLRGDRSIFCLPIHLSHVPRVGHVALFTGIRKSTAMAGEDSVRVGLASESLACQGGMTRKQLLGTVVLGLRSWKFLRISMGGTWAEVAQVGAPQRLPSPPFLTSGWAQDSQPPLPWEPSEKCFKSHGRPTPRWIQGLSHVQAPQGFQCELRKRTKLPAQLSGLRQ